MQFKNLLCAMLIAGPAFAGNDFNGFDHNSDPHLKTFIKNIRQLPDAGIQNAFANSQAWQQFTAQNGSWMVRFNEQTGKPHMAIGSPVLMGMPMEPQSVAYSFITSKLAPFNIPANDLVYNNTATNKKYHYVNYKQYYNGLEVLWARLQVKMLKTTGGVMQFQCDVYSDINVSPTPALSLQAAEGYAVNSLTGLTLVSSTVNNDLKILPVPNGAQNVYHLVYEVTVNVNDESGFPRQYYTLVDANNGEVLYRHNNINYAANTDVNVTGTLYLYHPYLPSSVEPLKYLKIVVNGTTYYTDNTGYLGLSNTTPVTANLTLEGQWAKIIDDNSGVTPSITANLNPGTNQVTFGAPAAIIEELSAYHSVNEIHDYYKAKLTIAGTGAENVMDFQMDTYTENTSGNCNAFYNGDINFYAAGGTCNATSLVADVIYHEYGHGINYDLYQYYGGNFGNGALGEGYADTWANGLTEDPVLGIGFFSNDPQGFVRRYDIDKKVYPQDLQGEVHADGEIIAGCWWDVALNFASVQDRQDLYVETFAATLTQPDGNEGVLYHDILMEALTADDNDGNLSNGTPRYCQITSAFAIHGITVNGASAALSHNEVLSAAQQTPVSINATVPSLPAGSTVNGYYKLNGQGSWTQFAMPNSTGTNYTGSIPAQPAGTVISYYVDMTDNCLTHTGVLPAKADDPANPNIPYYIMVDFNLLLTEDFDNFAGNWILDPFGTDQATTGIWEFGGQPIPSYLTPGNPLSMVQTDTQHTPGGSYSCFTANAGSATAPAGDQDVDNGATTLLSPSYDFTGYLYPAISYWRWYSNDQGATPGTDTWQVSISNDGGSTWVPVENTNVADHSWRRFVIRIADYVTPSSNVSLKFVAEDANAGSLIEAAFDDVEIWDQLPVGINEVNGGVEWTVYPNPAENFVSVNYINGSNESLSIEIANNIGQVVYSENLESKSGLNNHKVDVTSLSHGIYFVKLSGSKTNEVRKISVLR